jgi:hypothetical protein
MGFHLYGIGKHFVWPGVLLLLLLAGTCSDSPANFFRKQNEK